MAQEKRPKQPREMDAEQIMRSIRPPVAKGGDFDASMSGVAKQGKRRKSRGKKS